MPIWAQRLQWLFVAAFPLWAAWLLLGDPFGNSKVTIAMFTFLIIPAGVRAYFLMLAVARGEVNPFTGQDTTR